MKSDINVKYQAKRSGGGMGGVDQAQVILSQLNAANKVNSEFNWQIFCSVLLHWGFLIERWQQSYQFIEKFKHFLK